MGLLDRLKGGPKPGERWNGPAAWTDDYAMVERPGFYGLTEDGKHLLKPLVRLVAINHKPDDPDDSNWHLEVADKHDPPQKGAPSGGHVELEAASNGSSSTEAG